MKQSALFFTLCVSALLIFFFFPFQKAHATGSEPASNPLNTTSEVPQNFHTFVQATLLETLSAVSCIITGVDPSHQERRCLAVDPTSGKLGYAPANEGGAIGAMGGLIGMLYTPPMKTSDFIAYTAGNFGISDHAFAQEKKQSNGTGFQGLSPLIGAWTIFRNIVYLVFVILFVLVGMAIMLRLKIDPRTVMTIENQIPKIIVSLLLITFSFAIAGFVIDIMYVAIYFFYNLFTSITVSTPQTATSIQQSQLSFQNKNVMEVFNDTVGFGALTKDVGGGVGDFVGRLLTTGNGLGNPGDFLALLRDLIGGLIGLVAGWVAFLVVAVAILISMFRLWFLLIKSYALFLADVIFAPVWIVSGLLPGGPGFGGWLRDILAHLSVFPVTILMFLIGAVLKDAVMGANGTLFVAPLIGNANATGPLGALMGMSIIFITPEVAAITKEIFKSPDFKYFSAIGASVAAGSAGTKNIFSNVALSRFGTSKPGEKGLAVLAKKVIGI